MSSVLGPLEREASYDTHLSSLVLQDDRSALSVSSSFVASYLVRARRGDENWLTPKVVPLLVPAAVWRASNDYSIGVEYNDKEVSNSTTQIDLSKLLRFHSSVVVCISFVRFVCIEVALLVLYDLLCSAPLRVPFVQFLSLS